ncbi:MAG: histidine kinase [Burkholderiaceae bacterium]|nr:histidine kinase [Burkholderiaceae bacterium]
MPEQTDARPLPRRRSWRSAVARALTGCGATVLLVANGAAAAAGVPLQVRVGVAAIDVADCCTEPPARFDGAPLATVGVGPRSSPRWLRIDAPLAGEVLALRPVVDRATLYWRNRATGRWETSLTGDHVGPGMRTLAVAGMALPVPAAADDGPAYLRVEQPSFTVLRFERHPTGDYAALQARRLNLDLLLLGFVSAIVCYNLAVSALIRDRVFLLNAITILSMLVIAVYLAGYGPLYLWPQQPALGDQAMNLAMAVGNASGALLVREQLARGATYRGWLRALLGPVALAPLAWLAGVVAPYHVGRHALLVVSVVTLATATAALVPGVLRGERNARLVGLPFLLAMLPAIGTAALQRLTRPGTPGLPDNAFGSFLALEALLFSLVLAARVRSAEADRRTADAALLAARRDAGARILRAQDVERQRVAQDLHDSVGQRLLFLINRLRLLRLEAARQGFTAQASVGDALDDATDVLDGIRRISRAMHPATFDYLGWRGALESLVDAMNRDTPMNCTATFDVAAGEPTGEAGLHLYRIAQEGFNNVLRHAGATRCTARFACRDGRVTLAIEDNGVGPGDRTDPADRATGLGLVSIDERTRLLGGDWTIRPGASGGTRLEVSVPFGPGAAPGTGAASPESAP